MLREQRSSPRVKKEAEDWIVVAAIIGHREAYNFARKFRLNMECSLEELCRKLGIKYEAIDHA